MNTILSTCGLMAITLQTVSSLQATERPNILFILTDDQRDNSFSGMGHPWVLTPHIDALLQQGTRFENAYIAEPTCRPSRASILLGCHERLNRNGFSSKHKMNKEQWSDSYPVLLKKAGYTTAYVGKWHVKTDRLKTETLFDYCRSHDGHGEFYYDITAADGTKQTVTTNRYHTNNALNFLRSNMAKQPFCLSVSFATPHGSKVTKMYEILDKPASDNPKLKDHPIYGGEHGGMYRDIDIAYPLQNPEDPYKHIPQEVMDQNRGRSKAYRFDYDAASNKEHLYRDYQMITEIDQMVGELVAELKKQGLNEKTIVIYASDHGLLLGEYGMGGKGLLYDLSAKFPCFVVDPKHSALSDRTLLLPERCSGNTKPCELARIQKYSLTTRKVF